MRSFSTQQTETPAGPAPPLRRPRCGDANPFPGSHEPQVPARSRVRSWLGSFTSVCRPADIHRVRGEPGAARKAGLGEAGGRYPTDLKERSTTVMTSPCFSRTGPSMAAPFTCVGFAELRLNRTACRWKDRGNGWHRGGGQGNSSVFRKPAHLLADLNPAVLSGHHRKLDADVALDAPWGSREIVLGCCLKKITSVFQNKTAQRWTMRWICDSNGITNWVMPISSEFC